MTGINVPDMSDRETSQELIARWPVANAVAAVVRDNGEPLFTYGDIDREFPLASVTKLLTAYTALIAIEEGAVTLDMSAGPDGATIKHLLAHTSGLAFDSDKVMAAPGSRRLYSNAGFIQLAHEIATHAEIPFADYQTEALLQPLGMASTRLTGSPAAGAVSTVADLIRFATELQRPNLIDTSTLTLATNVIFPGLAGVLPGFGHHKPNDWGLGFEIRDHKDPHWTGAKNSASTFGHFGQSGTFLWVDRQAGLACIALTDRDFGPWAAEHWPRFADAVLTEFA